MSDHSENEKGTPDVATDLTTERLSDSTGDGSHITVNQNWASPSSFFRWFHPDDEPAERSLILKLDLSILTFACIGIWALYIDRSVFANAYVSGMREDLKFFGNQFVQINSIFTVGYAVSIIPLTMVNTRAPPNIVLPACMIVWGLCTCLGTRAASYSELAAYRFLTGLCEGAFFPSIHYVFGSWYRPDEISRRSGIFYVAGSIGTISTGFICASIFQHMDGALGHAAWRWMFLIGGLVTFPIAFFGVLTFPGTPQHPNRWLFRGNELALARARLAVVGRRPSQNVSLSLSSVKRFLGRWHFWILIPWSIIFQQGYLPMAQNTYTLWIKSNKQYTTAKVNNLTVVPPCVGIVAIVLFAWTTDRFGSRARLPLFSLAHLIAFLGILAFVVYEKSAFSYKWFGVAVSNVENAMIPVMYAWANLICTDDSEERAFILAAMLAFAMAFNSWVPILSLPTTEAPKYLRGYTAALVMQPVALVVAFFVNYLYKKQVARTAIKDGVVEDGGHRETV